MSKHYKYLKYVLRHKWFVYLEGRKLGLGISQLLRHDLSKFRPSEWVPYARFFYGGKYPTQEFSNRNPQLGTVLTQERIQADFDRAWLLHQHRNLHHWQSWLLREDNGDKKILPMPNKYCREMLADWRGTGKAIHGKDDTAKWYNKTRKGRILHSKTQEWVERQLFWELSWEGQ